ncbi:alpha/beta fold hydrolase [Pectobacterium aroidearum]|uniref:alpha/beta hydrolase n=1 Tax=Pectobacterium aroidearum TaxID=1201031 RepID=UPI0015F4B0A8|nr:alpha/beta fold hydrolase [Pectobacterium aroidearum]MBA5602051.1 alpha/beta fold hydrolase [Pectobacterium aroidearum]
MNPDASKYLCLARMFRLAFILPAVFSLMLVPQSLVRAAADIPLPQPLIIAKQGSFFFGGESERLKDKKRIYGDYAYAEYQIPVDAKTYPLIMWHGGGQSGKTWDSTADGRDGFKQIFTRRGWSVYIIDEPRTGRAGSSLRNGALTPKINASNQMLFEAFRLGTWSAEGKPHFYPGVQFPANISIAEAFIRHATPRTDGYTYADKSVDYTHLGVTAMKALLTQTGPSVLLTHSASGGPGWDTALTYPDKIKSIVAYEPGRYVFPEGEVPLGARAGASSPEVVSLAQFKILTRIPVQIVFGDNIQKGTFYDACLEGARSFVETINRHGGNAQLVVLPELGIKGNTHFPFSDLNNERIADLLSNWLHQNTIDK